MQMTNLKVTVEPASTLFKEEIDAIIAVVMDTVREQACIHDREVREGSFLFYAMKDGDTEPQQIIEADFEDGPDMGYHPGGSHDVADAILRKELLNSHREDKAAGLITYFVDSPIFLTLKATYGRFVCACLSYSLSYEAMTYIYCAVAKAISCMGVEDEVLQHSCNNIFHLESFGYANSVKIEKHVQELFLKCEIPELKLWKEWHDKESGNLTLFFE